MNFINTKSFNKKQKVLYDQDNYPTTDIINKIESDNAEDDYLLLDRKIASQATSIATEVSTTVATSIATDIANSTLNTKLDTSPLTLVSGNNEYIQITGTNSATNYDPTVAVTIAGMDDTGTGEVDVAIKAGGWGATHIGRLYGGDWISISSGNVISSTKSTTADRGITFEAKQSGAFIFKNQQYSGGLNVIPSSGKCVISSISPMDLEITTASSTKVVKLPTYVSLSGLGYYYGELTGGATALSRYTTYFLDYSANSPGYTNTFGSRVAWVNGTGLQNNSGYTMTWLVQCYFASDYVVSGSTKHQTIDNWFVQSAQGPTVRWGRRVRHVEVDGYVNDHITAVIQVPNGASVRHAFYFSPQTGGNEDTMNVYGFQTAGNPGAEVGNIRCHFIAQQIA